MKKELLKYEIKAWFGHSKTIQLITVYSTDMFTLAEKIGSFYMFVKIIRCTLVKKNGEKIKMEFMCGLETTPPHQCREKMRLSMRYCNMQELKAKFNDEYNRKIFLKNFKF